MCLLHDRRLESPYKTPEKAPTRARRQKVTFILRASSSALTAFSSWKRWIFCARFVAASSCPPGDAAAPRAASCSRLSTLYCLISSKNLQHAKPYWSK